MKSKLLALLFALFAAGCALIETPVPPRPKLVVFLVVDGLPQRQVVDYRSQLAPDGFLRFLDRGAWFADAHYGHAFTVTAAGHAAMLTGAYPHRTGIIGNDWRDRATGELVYCAGDTDHNYIGNKTNKLDGTSPRNLQVETVGDVLRRTHPAARVIGISGKDRGAILPAGKSGTAYMYMAGTGDFASTTYYMKDHPAWVKAFNAAKPADRFFKATWAPLLADAGYAGSQPDERPWYSPGGKLPKTLGAGSTKPDPAFYGSILSTPFGDLLTLDFARAAIVGEGLGQDNVTDILAVSLSSHDYINHAWGAESRLSHDHLLQLDRLLQAFFADLDRIVGPDNYVAVLTADHGFMPAPEYSATLGRDAGRVTVPELMTRLNAGLAAKFGPGNWARLYSASAVMFDDALIAKAGVDRRALEQETRRLLLTEPGIEAAFGRSDIEGNTLPLNTPFLAQVRRTWHRERSGDVQVVLKQWWMAQARRTAAATHGSAHPYDSQVPILFWGPRWFGAGRVDKRVEVVDIAPTLARLLEVSQPAAAEGKPLPLPARGK